MAKKEMSGVTSCPADLSGPDEPRISQSNRVEEVDPYMLINSKAFSNIVDCIKCDKCSSKCKWEIDSPSGYAYSIKISCSHCNKIIRDERSSPQVELFEPDSGKRHNHHDVNNRVVAGAIESGLSLSGLQTFLGILGVPGSITSRTYQSVSRQVYATGITMLEEHLAEARLAVRRRYMQDQDMPYDEDAVIDISVTFDGTWHKRGFDSNYGVGFCLDGKYGVVLDCYVLSKYCHKCAIIASNLQGDERRLYMESHKNFCLRNHVGSSASMETVAALEMWDRSTEYGFRYTTLISDCDTSVHTQLLALNPYGDDAPIEKEECINHIKKRMTTELSKIKREGKFGDVDGLTENLITEWSDYYRKAIVDNAPNVQKACSDIWAILKHNTSTAQEPEHEDCGPWCWYKKAKANGEEDPIPVPKNQLSKEVREILKPVFERLASPDLIKHCMTLSTQNRNESLYSTIWAKCPKTVFVGLRRLQNSVGAAVRQWNGGAGATLALAKELKIETSKKFKKVLSDRVSKRMKRATQKQEKKGPQQAYKQRKLDTSSYVPEML